MNVVGNVSGQSPIINPWAAQGPQAEEGAGREVGLGRGQYRPLAANIQRQLAANPDTQIQVGSYTISAGRNGRDAIVNSEGEAPTTLSDALESAFVEHNAQYISRPATEYIQQQIEAGEQNIDLSNCDSFAGRVRFSSLNRGNRLTMEGHDALRAGRYEQALTLFTTAARTDPNDPSHYMDQALCREALGQMDQARVAYDRSLAVAGENPLYGRAFMGQLRGNVYGALVGRLESLPAPSARVKELL